MENTRINDRYWKVEEIRSYIKKYLKNEFPEGIIIREFDKVDIMVLRKEDSIPVEIQRTPYNCKYGIKPSLFEDEIRRQIEQNIEIYGKCWFFFDEKFLDYLQNNLTQKVSMNMDWLYQFYKSGKARLFTITIDGIIRELSNKDFDFITKFSSTCKINKDEDFRILQKNKSKIAYNVFKDCSITDEIYNLYDVYEKNTEDLPFTRWLMRRGGKEKEFGKIIEILSSLMSINSMLKCDMNVEKRNNAISYSAILGLIEGNGKDNYIKFSDRYNISEYFPGYFEKQELWDYLRIHTIDNKTFIKTVKGEYDYMKDRKNQKSIEDW